MAGDNLIEKLSQKEAQELLKQKDLDVNKNFELLEKSADESAIASLNCDKPEIKLQRVRSGIVFVAPDFLQKPKGQKHIQQKKEINIYIQSFENICQQVNDYINKAAEALIHLKNPSTELNAEIKKILTEYVETVKNLCTPLVNENMGLNSININELSEEDKIRFVKEKSKIVDTINDFIREAASLNDNYLVQFKSINEDIQYICKSIEDIPNPINDLQKKIEDYKEKLEEVLDEITDENDDVHSKLLRIKDLFRLIKRGKKSTVKEMQEGINKLKGTYDSRKDAVNPLKEKIENNIAILRTKSHVIKNDIIKLREKYKQKKIELSDIKLKRIQTDNANNKINKILDINIKEKEKIVEKINDKEKENIEDKVIKQTSLDLLYLMDLTGSMGDYVDNTKKELINVMNKIIDSFNGIDINLGFIGYKDVSEHSNNDFIDMDFTTQHDKIKQKIEEVDLGGGDDIAEDIAWAFERALKKTWESNAKFIILTADAPCHGSKYHTENESDSYPNGVDGRKDIEESIKELCDQNICLLCIKLTDSTDIMFKVFNDIYIKNKKENNFFQDKIENAEYLDKVILEKSKEVYNMNREV